MKKMWWLSALLALPLVAAAGPLDVLGGVWNKILMIGGLSFLQGFGLIGFTRILIWILVFALFFAVMTGLGAGREGAQGVSAPFKFFGRRQAMVVAAVLATISAIFLPAAAILAVGAGWATAVGLILIGTPIIGLGYVLWNIPGKDKDGKSEETKGTVLLKLLISMLLFWILSAMNYSLVAERGVAIGSASVAGTMANFIAWALYIASIMIIYYIIKFFIVSPESSEEKEKRWQESGKAMGKWFGKKMDEQKAREEMGRRAQEVREPKAYLVSAIEACRELADALSVRTPEERPAAVRKAERHLKSLRKNLKGAYRRLRSLRQKERGQERAKFYEIFDNLHVNAGVALRSAKNISLPKANASDQEWINAYGTLKATAKGIIAPVCGKMVQVLNVFIEQNLDAARNFAASGLEQQVDERAQLQENAREERQGTAQQQAAQERVQEQARGQTQAAQQPSKLEQRLAARKRAVMRRKRGR